MTSSRAAQTARLALKHERRQSMTHAKTVSSRFSQKQSHFALRQEEAQVSRAQNASSSDLPGSRQVGHSLLAPVGHRGGGASTMTLMRTGSTESPSPFSGRNSKARGAGTVATTQGVATFGLHQKALRATMGTNRSTRRAALFNLCDQSSSQPSALVPHAPTEGGPLGMRRERAEGDTLDHCMQEGRSRDAPPRKLTREEKFREVLAKSRVQRTQLQRERAEREQETQVLDKEINALLHLLPKRNREAEDRELFANSGTPEVRSLLAQYKVGHVAKRVTLKASGDFSITSLHAPHHPTADGVSSSVQAGAVQASKKASFLDDQDIELLRKLHACTSHRSTEESAASLTEGSGASRQQKADRHIATDAADDFDAMMNTMRLDTRRAHAVDRTLCDDELEEFAAQKMRLAEDRRAMPLLGLQERDMRQLTRGEWLEQGGERAYDMNTEDLADNNKNRGEVYDDDNVDIPSSYEGDSDAEDVEVGVAHKELPDCELKLRHLDGELCTYPEATGTTIAPVLGSAFLDKILSEIEGIALSVASEDKDSHSSPEQYDKALAHHTVYYESLLQRLYHYAATHLLEVANTFRMILIEAERSFLRGQRRTIGRPTLLYLFTVSKLFPMTDYRHAVTTPFITFICSTLMQMRLNDLASVHEYLVLTAMLVDAMRDGNKFAAEAVVACLNVISLQVPRSHLEPHRYQGLRVPFPLVDRPESAVLDSNKDLGTAEQTAAGISLLSCRTDATTLVLFAYRMLEEMAEQLRSMPAFPTVFLEPLRALSEIFPLSAEKANTAIGPRSSAAHAALYRKVLAYSAAVEDHRTPLVMRTFRPRPIRLFDPLLAEQEENAVKTELRNVKREIREDKKRVIRHLTAEATVMRRAREKESAMVDAQQEKKLHQVMGQLQDQQRIMKTVDALMVKAKSKVRRGISGAPKDSDGKDNFVPAM